MCKDSIKGVMTLCRNTSRDPLSTSVVNGEESYIMRQQQEVGLCDPILQNLVFE